MVNKNVKALPAPETKTAWVSAPLRAFGFGRRSICVERDGTQSATCDHRQPLSFLGVHERTGAAAGRTVDECCDRTVSFSVCIVAVCLWLVVPSGWWLARPLLRNWRRCFSA